MYRNYFDIQPKTKVLGQDEVAETQVEATDPYRKLECWFEFVIIYYFCALKIPAKEGNKHH